MAPTGACDNAPPTRCGSPALYEQLIPIITPVVICALAGYFWALKGWTFDREFVTRMIMNIGAPALVVMVFIALSIVRWCLMKAMWRNPDSY